ncbi:MAG: LemA family protein [Patescibacteria group bacterium]|jgi:LemA protein|nr:LemA family protein [Patescibacteria group bacterium]
MSTALWIVLIVLFVLIFFIVSLYNGLIRLKNRVEEAGSDIDVQLKRRHDLIPNLVEIVRGYASHEKETLEKVIQARNSAISAQSGSDLEAKLKAENNLSSTLKSIFALSESYPDLKANQNFLELQRELSDTENKIQASRRFYNSNVRDFNTRIQVFPSNIIAKQLGFSSRSFFELEDDSERENIKIKF